MSGYEDVIQERYNRDVAVLELRIAELEAELTERLQEIARSHDEAIEFQAIYKKALADMRVERDRLREYADHILRQYSFDCDVDGGDAQDKALELGLIESRPINIEDSIDGETEHYFTVWTPREAALEPPSDKKESSDESN